MVKLKINVSSLLSVVLSFFALCVFLGGTATAAVYYMTEDGVEWTAATWYNNATGTGAKQTSGLDANSSYYIGKNPTDTQRAKISTTKAFDGKTLYIGINPDGTLPTTSNFVNGASTVLITINSNQTLNFADDIQLGNGIIAFTGNGNISGAVLSGKTDAAKITVAANATNAVLRNWASNDTRSYTLDIPLTGGSGAKISVYTLNPTKSQYVGTITLSQSSPNYTGSWELTRLSRLDVTAANALGTGGDMTLGQQATLNINANQNIGNLKTSSYVSTGNDLERTLTENGNIKKTEKDTRTVNVAESTTLAAKSVKLGAKDSLNLKANAKLSITGTGTQDATTPINGDATTTFEAANNGSAALEVDVKGAGLTNFKGSYQTATGAKMTLKSTAATTVSNPLNVGANSTMELNNNVAATGTQSLNFTGAIAGTGTININTNDSKGTSSDRRIYIKKADSEFAGTWNVLAGSYLYTDTNVSYNLGGKGTAKPSLVLAKNSKLIQNSKLEEFKNLTVSGSGVILTMINGVTTKVTDTLTVWSDTKINANRNALFLASTNADGSTKTLYAKNIVLNSTDTATEATICVGAADLNGTTYTNYNGTLYAGTLGTTDKKMNVTLYSGTVGQYDSNTQIKVNGYFAASGDPNGQRKLVLNVAENQTAPSMEITSFMRLWSDLTLNAPSKVTLTGRKPTQVIAFDEFNPKKEGAQPGGTLVLGTTLSGNKMYIGQKGVYLAKDEDTLHTYYRSGGAWKRYGMENETYAPDSKGVYYIKQGDGTIDLKGLTCKAVYAGYDVATGNISGSKTDPGTTNPTIVIYTLNTELHLGKGGAYAGSGDTNVLNGTVITEAGTDYVIRMNNTSENSRSLTINSAISGSGSLTFTGRTNTSYKTVSKIYLTGDNSEFTGTLNILNEIPVFADGENSLGSGTVTMNPTTIYDQTGKNPQNAGATRLWVGANQDLTKLTYNMTDAKSFVAVDQNATLTLDTLELGQNFTFADRTETFPKSDGSTFTKDYKAGTIDVASIVKPGKAAGDTVFTLANGTLKAGTIGAGITLKQTGGVLEVSDSATNRLMEIYGDYEQGDGTLQLTFDSEGNDAVYVHGALTLDSLTLFGEDECTQETLNSAKIIQTEDEVFDLNMVKIALEGTLSGLSVTNRVYNPATKTWSISLAPGEGGGVPEPATWVLLALGMGLLSIRKRK